MRKFILKVILLGIITTLFAKMVYFVGDHISEKVYGPNTKYQIEKSFENALASDASNWILGNSRIYRGLNPDMIDVSSWYNFAHDNDSYNQMYYKLKYLLDHGCKIDTLVIGTDYFQFSNFSDTRNYVYDRLLGSDYIKDYNSFLPKEWLNNGKRYIITKQGIISAIVLYINNLVTTGGGTSLIELRKNGSYINDMGGGREDDFTKRDSTMGDVQIRYYEQILELCKNEHIELFVLMMPVRDNELKNYNNHFIEKFNDYIKESLKANGFESHYIDMSNHLGFKDYRMYTDITHLNSQSADSYTKCFYKELVNKNKPIK